MTTPTKEALKTFGRVILISVIPVAISALQNGTPFKEAITALAVAVLIAVDNYIHENPDIKANGLIPF